MRKSLCTAWRKFLCVPIGESADYEDDNNVPSVRLSYI